MKKLSKKLFGLLLLTGIVVGITGCAGTGLVLEENYDPQIHARIRVLFPIPNSAWIYPGKSCYAAERPAFFSAAKSDPDSIIAHAGGKNFGMVNALSVLTNNRKVGMPATSDITWNHHEYIVPAMQPLTLESVITTTRDPAYRYSSHTCRTAVTFIPEAGKDYDSVFVMHSDGFIGSRSTKVFCTIQVREIPPDGTDPVVIATEEAQPC